METRGGQGEAGEQGEGAGEGTDHVGLPGRGLAAPASQYVSGRCRFR